MSRPGTVYLVGAGPGNPELITVRGLRTLRAADVVVYDRLAGVELLREARADAERVFAGKAAGFAALSQRGIEGVLIDRAREGKTVVRLKGGDPFLFGRGGEEVEALHAAGIPYEVVPGVSSALAAPLAAGIPVTQRGLASSVTIVTGHEDSTKRESDLDWSALAATIRTGGTLVVLMGLERVESIASCLGAHGVDAGMPAAAVSSATLANQRVVLSTLRELVADIRQAELQSPTVLVIGEVAAFPMALADSARLATAV